MRTFSKRTLFAVCLTIACLGVPGAGPVAAQEKPGERARRREVEAKCAEYKKRYEEAEKAATRPPQGQLEEARKKRDAALKDYCECLKYWFADAGIPLPEKYEQLCNPKPVEPPADQIPEEFRADRRLPTRRPCREIRALRPTRRWIAARSSRTTSRPTRRSRSTTGRTTGRSPQRCKKKLERLKKRVRRNASIPGQAPHRKGNRHHRQAPQVPLPDKGKTRARARPIRRRLRARGRGVQPGPRPAPRRRPYGWLDAFFRGRTIQETKGARNSNGNSIEHAKHCNLCLEVRNGRDPSLRTRPGDPSGVLVTLLEPPVPTIECRAKAGGGFDCRASQAPSASSRRGSRSRT